MDGGYAAEFGGWSVMRCPGFDPANVKPMSAEAHARVTAGGGAREYHLAAAHPHLFCGCGNEAADCHPGRCCRDDDYGQCANCGRPGDLDPEPIPEADLSDPLFLMGGCDA